MTCKYGTNLLTPLLLTAHGAHTKGYKHLILLDFYPTPSWGQWKMYMTDGKTYSARDPHIELVQTAF